METTERIPGPTEAGRLSDTGSQSGQPRADRLTDVQERKGGSSRRGKKKGVRKRRRGSPSVTTLSLPVVNQGKDPPGWAHDVRPQRWRLELRGTAGGDGLRSATSRLQITRPPKNAAREDTGKEEKTKKTPKRRRSILQKSGNTSGGQGLGQRYLWVNPGRETGSGDPAGWKKNRYAGEGRGGHLEQGETNTRIFPIRPPGKKEPVRVRRGEHQCDARRKPPVAKKWKAHRRTYISSSLRVQYDRYPSDSAVSHS